VYVYVADLSATDWLGESVSVLLSVSALVLSLSLCLSLWGLSLSLCLGLGLGLGLGLRLSLDVDLSLCLGSRILGTRDGKGWRRDAKAREGKRKKTWNRSEWNRTKLNQIDGASGMAEMWEISVKGWLVVSVDMVVDMTNHFSHLFFSFKPFFPTPFNFNHLSYFPTIS
jgi:hypothetical protein